MRRQIQIYLTLFLLAILQGNLLSVAVKSKNLLSSTTKHVENEGNDDNEVDVKKLEECNDINKGLKDIAEVVSDNPDTEDNENPKCTNNCKDPNQKIDLDWTQIPKDKCLKFHDVGVSSEGFIVGIGANGKLYEYVYDLDYFLLIEGDFELYNLRRVDVGYDGLIYVINYSGDTYYLNCNRYWIKLPGCAIDIGTGRGDEVVKIGCDGYCDHLQNDGDCPNIITNIVEKSSPHIYKLICRCDCRCRRRRCFIFVKHVFTCEKDIDRLCYWIKYPVGPTCKKNGIKYPMEFTRIDVNANGYPMVIGFCEEYSKTYYYIFQMIGNNDNVFKTVVDKADKPIQDLCGDNYGNIFFIKDNYVYIYDKDGNFKIYGGSTEKATNISCGPYALPTITTDKCCMETTTKVGYN